MPAAPALMPALRFDTLCTRRRGVGRVEAGRRCRRKAHRPVAQPRSSNRRCGWPASGVPTGFNSYAGSRTRPLGADNAYLAAIPGDASSEAAARSHRHARPPHDTPCRSPPPKYARSMAGDKNRSPVPRLPQRFRVKYWTMIGRTLTKTIPSTTFSKLRWIQGTPPRL
jgi:hypothetical protein